MKTTIGVVIVDWVTREGITLTELAHRVDRDKNYLIAIVNGLRPAPASLLLRLEREMGLAAGTLTDHLRLPV